MTRTASSYSARSSWVYGALRGVILVVVGGKWAQVLCTPPDRKVVGAGPVGSGHGSYQLVSWWGGQCWWPPMAHAQWWKSRRHAALACSGSATRAQRNPDLLHLASALLLHSGAALMLLKLFYVANSERNKCCSCVWAKPLGGIQRVSSSRFTLACTGFP